MSVSESGTRVPPLLSFTVTLPVSNDISEFTYQIALTHKYAPPPITENETKAKHVLHIAAL